MPHIFTTAELADLLNVETWHIQRIFEQGDVPEPARFAGKRAIPKSVIPTVIDALRAHGWLECTQEQKGVGHE